MISVFILHYVRLMNCCKATVFFFHTCCFCGCHPPALFDIFPYLVTLCECEHAHVRSDILLASSPQCPLPFLPPAPAPAPAPHLCFTACLFSFYPQPHLSSPSFLSSPLATHSLVSLTSHFLLFSSVFTLRL